MSIIDIPETRKCIDNYALFLAENLDVEKLDLGEVNNFNFQSLLKQKASILEYTVKKQEVKLNT